MPASKWKTACRNSVPTSAPRRPPYKGENRQPRARPAHRPGCRADACQRKQSGDTEHATPQGGKRECRVARQGQCRTEGRHLPALRLDTNCRQAERCLPESTGPQYVSLGITLPILDWGRGRGQYAWPVLTETLSTRR